MRDLVSVIGVAVWWVGLSGLLATTRAASGAPPSAGTPTAIATVNPTDAACVGNCNGDGSVTVNELITGVNIALGVLPVTACPAFDRDRDGMVAVSELVAGVGNLLFGCGMVPPTLLPTAIATPSPSSTPVPADTATPSASPSTTRTPTNTGTATSTPTAVASVCGGFVSSLPVVCNLTAVPNPVSRSGTIAFRFGISDLDGDINRVCIQLTYPPLEPQTSCAQIVPDHRLINAIQTTTPTAASVLQFGTYQAALQAFDAAGHQSNVITATFQVQ